MMKATNFELEKIAGEMALFPFHGNTDGNGSNFAPLITYFPKWNVRASDGAWCAAFAYHCCRLAGYDIPYSPDECVSCNLAGCVGRDEFAQGDQRIGYYKGPESVDPLSGDIVIFDRLVSDKEHDQIGTVLNATGGQLITAEGTVESCSGIVTRRRDEHIRAFIRLPDGYRYWE